MGIKARVNIETAKKAYKPGEYIREELSTEDINYLKSRGFIVMEDENDRENFPEGNFAEENRPYGVQRADPRFSPLWEWERRTGLGETDYKDEAALKKMSKDEIVKYAESIGLQLNESSTKQNLVDAVLNYMEEKAAELEDE